MSQTAKEQNGEDHENAKSDHHEEESINDPLTQSDTGAPKVPWQTTPE